MITTKALTQKAQNGDADAQFRLGYRFAFGWNQTKPTDWRTARAWWDRAAAQNHTAAKRLLRELKRRSA